MNSGIPPPAPTPALASDIASLDSLLNESALAPHLKQFGRAQVTAALRALLTEFRQRAISQELPRDALRPDMMARELGSRLAQHARPQLRAVFNLTGTVLHTNLGRALLPDAAVQSVLGALKSPVNLEFDLKSGARGERDRLVESLLCELTGAEAATVVNNNAAAVLLILGTLANRREVLVSRGELVEIGGAFRIPDVMRGAGAKLVEVGTTNRTHAADYVGALNARTALLMKVHASNYCISGFTASVGIADLAAIGRAHGLPVAVDLGSGSLIDLEQWGLPKEPTVRHAIAAGADLVAFSGDKLLGGPQAGIIVGRAALVQRLRKNPLRRALRVGKLTLAALEPVLALYRAPELLGERLPTLRLLTRAAADIEAQARRLMPPVQAALGGEYAVSVASAATQIGSGALPIDLLASHALCVRKVPGKRVTLDGLEAALRAVPRPIIGRIAEKTLWLDLRCLDPSDEAEFLAQWNSLHR